MPKALNEMEKRTNTAQKMKFSIKDFLIFCAMKPFLKLKEMDFKQVVFKMELFPSIFVLYIFISVFE